MAWTGDMRNLTTRLAVIDAITTPAYGLVILLSISAHLVLMKRDRSARQTVMMFIKPKIIRCCSTTIPG
jgi:hypothetical protein